MTESAKILTDDEPQAWTHARLLDGWLAQKGRAVTKREILQLGPNPVREKARRDAAIDVLLQLDRARFEKDGRRDVLVRNPRLGPAAATATSAASAAAGDEEAETVADVADAA